MDPQTDPIYAGIAGARLECGATELGLGVSLSPTFAHLMAPFLLSFDPVGPGKPPPGIISAVQGQLGFDIHMQLFVPAELEIPNWFDRLKTVWWIGALLRLKTGWPLQVPVIADRPFSEIQASWRTAVAFTLEIAPRLSAGSGERTIGTDDFDWLRDSWLEAGRLMHGEPRFRDAFQAFDRAPEIAPPSVALLVLWSALEHLFSPARAELKFRVASYIAAFLEQYGEKRRTLRHKIGKLYDARSRASHAAGVDESEAFGATFRLLQRVLLKMIADGAVPSHDDLDALLFGES